jgi:uncharacterized protein YbjT (DUF2867 family)
MTIALIGANGKVGPHVLAQLEASATPVTVIARTPSKVADGAPTTTVVAGDLDDVDSLRRGLAGCSTLITIEADDSAMAARSARLTNVAVDAGVKRIVRLSAQSAGVNPPVSFGKFHAVADAALTSSATTAGIEVAIARPVFFSQTFRELASTIRTGKIIMPSGKGRVAFVDVRDVAAVLAALATAESIPSEPVVLTGPSALSFGEAAAVIGTKRGKPVKHLSPPGFIVRKVMPKAAGVPPFVAGLIVELAQAIKQGAQERPTDWVRTLTGHDPRPFSAMVDDHLDEFRPA